MREPDRLIALFYLFYVNTSTLACQRASAALRSPSMKTLRESTPRFPKPIRIDLANGSLGDDPHVERASTTVGALAHVFADEAARQQIDSATVVYAVEYWKPIVDGTEGGLYWRNSTVFPGIVGDEYFMTRGHFHGRRNRAEYYATASGAGLLVLMDEQRRSAVHEMSPGTTHYTPGP
jgi:glucose-6-phosphate isomerase